MPGVTKSPCIDRRGGGARIFPICDNRAVLHRDVGAIA